MLIIGEKEVTSKTISVRVRETDQTENMTLPAFIDKIKKEIEERV